MRPISGGFPDTELDEVSHRELNRVIEDTIQAASPEVVYTHSDDELHKDHLAIHESTLVATRPGSGVESVLAYEIPTSTDRGSGSAQFQPTKSIDIQETLETKVEALSAHEGETQEFPIPGPESLFDTMRAPEAAGPGTRRRKHSNSSPTASRSLGNYESF